MEYQELKQNCLELMETSEAAYLATIDASGFPCIRAVTNLRRREEWPGLAPFFEKHRDDFLVYILTNTSSNKVRQVAANPAGSIYYCCPAKFHGLMLEGFIEVVEDDNFKRGFWQPGWERYYAGGPEDPDYALLRLRPLRASGWWEERTFAFSLPQP